MKKINENKLDAKKNINTQTSHLLKEKKKIKNHSSVDP